MMILVVSASIRRGKTTVARGTVRWGRCLASALMINLVCFATHAQALDDTSATALQEAVAGLVATWPASADDRDLVLLQIETIYECIARVFPGIVNLAASHDPKDWTGRRSPQSLGQRRAALVHELEGRTRRNAGASTSYPRTPTFFAIPLHTPVPGRADLWHDLVLLDTHQNYVLAIRPGTENRCVEFVLMDWSTGVWRSINGTWYPDGSPEQLWCWKERVPDAFCATWDTSGAYRGSSIRDGRFIEAVVAGVNTVSIAYPDPGERDSATSRSPKLFPVPFAAIRLVPAGQRQTITPPAVPGFPFTGWAGDAGGMLRDVVLDGDTSKELVAKLAWSSLRDGYTRPMDPALESTLRKSIANPEGPLSWRAAHGVRELDLSHTQFKGVDELRAFQQLEQLDLTGTPVTSAYPMSRFAAIESVLTAPSTIGDPGLYNRVLLALNAGLAPPIKQLTLNGTELQNVEDLAFLTELEVLHLANARIKDIRFVSSMTALEELDASENEISDLSPLLLVPPSLLTMNFSKNRIWALTSLLERPAWPANAHLDLRGNPLDMRTLCDDLPVLESRGITVLRDDDCDRGTLRRADVDIDGDGYSEVEEWQFVALFSADAAEREARYEAAKEDPDVPAAYLALLPGARPVDGKPVSVDSIPTTRFDISLEGRGSAYPGPGAHEFARFVFHEDHTWSDNTITITPVPEAGWGFVPWSTRDLDSGWVRPSESGDGLVFNMNTAAHARFVFEQEMAPLEIDLVEALLKFVTTYYPDEDPYLFDKNELSYHDNRETRPAPNGMPDAAELRLLQGILQSPTYDYYGQHGTSFSEAMGIWNINLPIAQRALGAIAEKEPYLAHLLCAWATLGSSTDREAMINMIRDKKGLNIERDQFKQGLWTVLAPDESIHTRATWNKVLWKRVSSGRTIDRSIIDAYAELVLSQTLP